MLKPHQNKFIILWSSSSRVDGNRKTLIQYVGMDWVGDMMSVSLPTFDKFFVNQWFSLLQILSFKKLKTTFFFLLMLIDGSP